MTPDFDFRKFFTSPYDRKSFTRFLDVLLGNYLVHFDPEPIDVDDMNFNYITEVTPLGELDDLDLFVYEVKHKPTFSRGGLGLLF